MKLKKYLFAHIAIFLPLVAALTLATTAALYVKDDARSGGSYGEIGLRSYFDSGSGYAGDPFVITRPRHLYNLSRLQGLGVFADPERAHFQLGKKGLGGYDYGCYTGDYGYTPSPFLDMTGSNRQHEPINAIGSESVPFYGVFDGKGVEIKNLTVFADPQDAGLFGYTAHGSMVHDIFLDNITISTNGYSGDYTGLYANENGVTRLIEGVPTLVYADFKYYASAADQNPAVIFDLEDNNNNYKQDHYEVGWNLCGEVDESFIPSEIPYITFGTAQNSGYKFKMLQSGSFLTAPTNDRVSIDYENVFKFFNDKVKDISKLYQYQTNKWVHIDTIDKLVTKKTVANLSALNSETGMVNGDVYEVSNVEGEAKLYQYIFNDAVGTWKEITPTSGLIGKKSVADKAALNAETGMVNGDIIDVLDAGSEEYAYELTASSSVSLIASLTDSYGLDHSRVLMTLVVTFSLESRTSSLTMDVNLSTENHGNNIGLVVGHCDGSIRDCYVYKGKFDMNTEGNALENKSSLGLLGLVGGTVFNKAAIDSDSTSADKKEKGSLNFTSIFDDIVIDSTEAQQTGLPVTYPTTPETYNSDAIYYYPSDSKFAKYLRYVGAGNNKQYVTAADLNSNHQISFAGQTVIKEKDLGIFTIATDYFTNGLGSQVTTHINDSSKITAEETSYQTNGNYYLYYATGEFNASLYGNNSGDQSDLTAKKTAFGTYRDSFNSDQPNQLLLGHHFPKYDEITKESFAQREAHQNYFFRMKLDPSYRSSSRKIGYYFSDVDRSTRGGSFLSKYFNYKLVDASGFEIPAGTSKCGIQLLESNRDQVKYFKASFALPDISGGSGNNLLAFTEGGEIANTVNFEIYSAWANVTVVASPYDSDKPAALGVYRIEGDQNWSRLGENSYLYSRHFENPDYAFFMPKDERLAYFDYEVDQSGVGKIGTRSSNGNFTAETEGSTATVAKTFEKSGNSYSRISEFGHTNGRSRLFIHTFKLPAGKYCFGSPTGANSSPANSLGRAKLYYVSAQGQVDGQYGDDNTYASDDVVENVDFLMLPRFTVDGNDIITNYAPISVGGQRCYVALASSDRSTFADEASNISFVYEDNKFKITTTTLSAMTKIVVNNYKHKQPGEPPNVTVYLFSQDNQSNDDVLVYPRSEQQG